ncbi:MAG: DEAD/DEAH box helicase [Rivularia sp. (in: cyanobacteria)]
MAEELKKFNQPQQENQPEPQKAENVDNRLPYEPPKLRKHGKINGATKLIIVANDFDGDFPFTDFS